MPTMTAEQVERTLPTITERIAAAPDSASAEVICATLAIELECALRELSEWQRAYVTAHGYVSARVQEYLDRARGQRLRDRVERLGASLDAALARREGDGDGR